MLLSAYPVILLCVAIDVALWFLSYRFYGKKVLLIAFKSDVLDKVRSIFLLMELYTPWLVWISGVRSYEVSPIGLLAFLIDVIIIEVILLSFLYLLKMLR